MNPREQLLQALNHQEGEGIPIDLGSTQVTGIALVAYQNLRKALGLPLEKPSLCDEVQQLALPGEDFLAWLKPVARGLYPICSHNQVVDVDMGDSWHYIDEWGITHQRLKPDGLYYSVLKPPLERPGLAVADVERHPWPDMSEPRRFAGLRQQAEKARANGYAVVLKDGFAGIFEFSQRIVGMVNCLTMLASPDQQDVIQALFNKLLEIKLAYWKQALNELGDLVDVVALFDDYGSQESQLISPRMYRTVIKPLYRTLIGEIKRQAPHVKCFFHSCGSVRPLLPDFIEIGVDILNPVHVAAKGMEPQALKRDFGKDLVFWGGGVDTQHVLPTGTPQQVRDDVRRNLDSLAPGGGYVFCTVHDIQADVPPENLIAMWETVKGMG